MNYIIMMTVLQVVNLFLVNITGVHILKLLLMCFYLRVEHYTNVASGA